MTKGSLGNPYSYNEYLVYKECNLKHIGFVEFEDGSIWLVSNGMEYPVNEGSGIGTGTNFWPGEDENIGSGTGSSGEEDSDTPADEFLVGGSPIYGTLNVENINWSVTGTMKYVVRLQGNTYVKESIYGTLVFSPMDKTDASSPAYILKGEEFETFLVLKDYGDPSENRNFSVLLLFKECIDSDGNEFVTSRHTVSRRIEISSAPILDCDYQCREIYMGSTIVSIAE